MPAFAANEASVKMTHHPFELIFLNAIWTPKVCHGMPPALEIHNSLDQENMGAGWREEPIMPTATDSLPKCERRCAHLYSLSIHTRAKNKAA